MNFKDAKKLDLGSTVKPNFNKTFHEKHCETDSSELDDYTQLTIQATIFPEYGASIALFCFKEVEGCHAVENFDIAI